MNRQLNRRDFIRLFGIGTAAAGTYYSLPKIVAKSPSGVLVESQDQYNGFLVEKLAKGNFPYRIDPDVLKPMREVMTVFSRNIWDPIRSKRPERTENLAYDNLITGKGKIPNQTRLDYAFQSAAWFSARSLRGTYRWTAGSSALTSVGNKKLPLWNPQELDMTWEATSLAVKHAALFYGASLAGIADLNPLWLYTDIFAPSRQNLSQSIPVINEDDRFEQSPQAWYIPHSLNKVIVLAFEEDYFGIANSPGRLASAAVGDGYSRMAITASTLAEFIRGLGYRALPAGNGVGLSIPMAIDAGLGQLGRMGLLITPKYGPRVRLAKVITDMPLIADAPIDFGVTEFCETCKLCAEECPSESISKGQRAWKGISPSNNPGVFKWYINPESCYDFNGFSCSNCKRVCPFNKPNNSWIHRLTRQIIKGRLKGLDKVMVTLDQTSGYGEQLQDKNFWKMDGKKCITSRERM